MSINPGRCLADVGNVTHLSSATEAGSCCLPPISDDGSWQYLSAGSTQNLVFGTYGACAALGFFRGHIFLWIVQSVSQLEMVFLLRGHPLRNYSHLIVFLYST